MNDDTPAPEAGTPAPTGPAGRRTPPLRRPARTRRPPPPPGSRRGARLVARRSPRRTAPAPLAARLPCRSCRPRSRLSPHGDVRSARPSSSARSSRRRSLPRAGPTCSLGPAARTRPPLRHRWSPRVAAAPQTNGQASIVDIAKAVSPAVVTIVADGVTATDPTTGQTGVGTATGSGVIFDANGLILTNHHVVEGNPSKLTVNLKDGRSFDATIYGIDTLTDLAIVKVNATGLPTAPIGDSSTIQVGQQAIAIGSPLGTFTDSVTSGIISAVGRSIPVESGQLSNLIQTDTAINPGNSGGPLLDPSGKVIGINTAVAGQAQDIGFAIPINIARPIMAQASAGQALARPWLGVQFQTIDPTVKKANNLPVDNGAWIGGARPTAGGPGGLGGRQAGSPAAQGRPQGRRHHHRRRRHHPRRRAIRSTW